MPDPQPSFDPEAYLAAAAPLLGLTLDPAWIAPILANLRVLASAGDLVSSFPLPDDIEAAPRFEP